MQTTLGNLTRAGWALALLSFLVVVAIGTALGVGAHAGLERAILQTWLPGILLVGAAVGVAGGLATFHLGARKLQSRRIPVRRRKQSDRALRGGPHDWLMTQAVIWGLCLIAFGFGYVLFILLG